MKNKLMKSSLAKILFGGSDKIENLQQLRERLLGLLLLFSSAIGIVLYLFFFKLALKTKLFDALTINTLVFIWLLSITFSRRIDYRLRVGSFLFLIYILGVINLVYNGFNVDAGLFLLTFIAMSALLVGLRGGIIALLLSGITVPCLGYLVVTARLPIRLGLSQVEPMLWIIGGTIFLLMGSLLTITLTAVIRGLENNLVKAKALSEEIQRSIRTTQEIEERFRALIENSSDVITILEGDGTIKYASPSIERQLGYKPEELTGRKVFEFLHQDSLKIAVDALTPGVPPEAIGPMVVLRIRHQNGSWRTVEVIGNEMSSNPVIRGTIVNCRDITERKVVEDKLRESHQLLERTFKSIRDAIFIIDAEMAKIIDCNPAASELFGYHKDEILGQTVDFLHVDGAAPQVFRRQLYQAVEKDGFLSDFEFRMKRKDGTIFPTEHNMMPLEDPQGGYIGWVSVLRDITMRKQAENLIQEAQVELEKKVVERTNEIIERKRAEKELEKRNRELKFSRERMRMLAQQVVTAQEEERQRISRELHDESGQALVGLKLSLDTIYNDIPKDMRSVRKRMKAAIDSADRTMGEMRTLAHSLRPPTLDLGSMDIVLKGLCSKYSENTGLAVEYSGANLDLPGEIKVVLYRFVQEALTNVAKHARASQVIVRLGYKRKKVILTVEDNGIGLERKQASQGMGLIGMRERIGLLEGRLSIRSARHGTRLDAFIPWDAELNS